MAGVKKRVVDDSKKKTRRIVIIVLICFGALFLLFLLFNWFVLSIFRSAIHTDIPNIPTGSPQGNAQVSSREFLRSDKLTTISFARTEAYGNTNLNINFVLSGYLHEVPVYEGAEPMDTARVYAFDNDNLQWSYSAHELDDENPDCVYTYDVTGSGNSPTLSLEDSSLYEEARSLKIEYAADGQTGTPELSVFGKLLLPLDIKEDIAVHRPSQNVGAICSGYTESTVVHKPDTENLRFPLILSNVNINSSSLKGSAQVEEQSYSPSGNAFLDSSEVVVTTPYVISYSDNPTVWDVNWEINLP